MENNNMTDTERLNFLLKYFSIEDVGDEIFVPGVYIECESLEEDLTWGVEQNGRRESHFRTDSDDMRDIIDRAIKSHGL